MKSVRSAVLAAPYSDAPPASHSAARVRTSVAVTTSPWHSVHLIAARCSACCQLCCALSLGVPANFQPPC